MKKQITKLKCWISKGEFTTGVKNGGNPSKRDISDDYSYVWFAKESIPDKRGMVEATILL